MTVTTRVYSTFHEALDENTWSQLLRDGGTQSIFLTWHWQRAWWEELGQGRLLLVVAERNDQVVAVAPLFAADATIMFVGTGPDSYYLDFVGDIDNPAVIDALLSTALDQVPDCAEFQLHWILDTSPTRRILTESARRLGLDIQELWSLPVPELEVSGQPELALNAANRKSMRRYERGLVREAPLEVTHITDAEVAKQHLPEFFSQHVSRWADRSIDSKFVDSGTRRFYERVVQVAGDQGWLRFTRVLWKRRAIAHHLGFRYGPDFMYYQPAFDVELASHSPGKVLLRQLILAAIDDQVNVFDLGPGEQEYKLDFATRSRSVSGYSLAARSADY